MSRPDYSVPLFLGRSPEWWDSSMLVSLAFAAFAAIAVLFFTAGSVKANKRATRDAENALLRYQTTTAARVAEANQSGVLAGEKAGRAQAEIEKAQAQIAAARAETARFGKEAAEANLATEQLKAAVSWRTLTDAQASALTLALGVNPGQVNIRYTDGDPEALYLAIQIDKILTAAGWKVAPGATKLANGILFGIHIPNGFSGAAALQKAFSAAGLNYSSDPIPSASVSFSVATITGAATLFIGSRPPSAL